MAVTTNYNWSTPDDTALVKDGASAIRTLGTSIDTTTKNLNPSTTLGDIEYRSSTANTNTRLGIGSTGQVLTVAGGVPSWAAPAAAGLTLLSTTTLSGTTTTISSISQDYKNLFILVSGVTWPTSDTTFACKINNTVTSMNFSQSSSGGAPDAYAVEINRVYFGVDTSTGKWRLNNSANYLIFQIFDYSDTATWKAFSAFGTFRQGDNSRRAFSNFGVHESNSAVTSLVFGTELGTVSFSAGTVEIYGGN